MSIKHTFLTLLIMALFGSAFVVGKLVLITNVPPILFGSLRMLVVLICLIPFWKFEVPSKKYFLSLAVFSLSMGVGVTMFTYLALNSSSIVSPIIIGSQLAVPFAIMLSSFFLGEKFSLYKWFLVFFAFIGIVLLGFDPNLINNKLALVMTILMAFFYAVANVSSRKIKDIKVTTTNGFMALVGVIVLLTISQTIEGNIFLNIQGISNQMWILIIYSGLVVSVGAHMSLFYLYKYYSVGQVLPFYALFPVFGVIQTFLVFKEIPTVIIAIGGLIVITSVFFLQKKS